MYIPPGFTVITCEPVSEEAFRAWAEENGGVLHIHNEEALRVWAVNNGYAWPPRRDVARYPPPAKAIWELESCWRIELGMETLSKEDVTEWTPLMHLPPQNTINVHLWKDDADGLPLRTVIHSLLARWDSYAYDLGFHDWVSDLLHAILPAERIIRYEPPPLSAGPAWIWINGKYTRNEAYHDNCDADKIHDKNQL